MAYIGGFFKTKYAGNCPDHEAKVRGAAYIGGAAYNGDFTVAEIYKKRIVAS